MIEIKDKIVLVEKERKIQIGEVLVKLSIEYPKFKEKVGLSNNYQRFIGEIKLDFSNIPDELIELLEEQNQYANDFCFSLLDEVADRINKFPIYILGTMTKVYGLVCEEGNGGFEIDSKCKI